MKIVLFLLALVPYAHPQMLLRRTPGVVKETCPEHVALTRHWLLDAARVSPARWHRQWLTAAYKKSFSNEAIEAVCQDNKTQAQFDIDLADIRLQMAYDKELRAAR